MVRSRKMGGSTFGRKARTFKITAAYPATIPEAGEGERGTNNQARQGPGGDIGEVDFN